MSCHLRLAALSCAVFLSACGGGGGNSDDVAVVEAASATAAAPAPTPVPDTAATTAPAPAPAPTPTPTPVAEAVVDQFVGTWLGCFVNNPNESFKEIFVFTKQSDTLLSSSSSLTKHSNSTCAGAGTAEPGEVATVDFAGNGTKFIGTQRVNKISVQIISSTPKTLKQIIARQAATMNLGDGSSTKDAEGYPSTLSNPFTKQ